MKKIILVCLAAVCALPAAAKLPSFEWGAIVGVNMPNFEANNTSRTDVSNKMGWQAGIVTSVSFGWWSLDPQIIYSHQKLMVKDAPTDVETTIKANSVDVPILFDLRVLKPLRIYAGPVITVMNDCDKVVGQIRPTFSYALGVSLKLSTFLIDLRYNGQFVGKKNIVTTTQTKIDKLHANTLALSVGFMF